MSSFPSTADQAAPQLRIGAVNYLNTKPLVHGLAEDLPRAELSFHLPSQLADALADGLLDVALAPTAELAKHPEWSILSTACIGCLGPVMSVKLLFRKPPSEVRSLALDEGSRTSVVLAQLLLAELHRVRPELLPFPIHDSPEATPGDAVLVIGDRAMQPAEEQFIESWDLGERWRRLTGLPFVFAMWLARPGVECADAAVALDAARDRGLAALPEISARAASAMDLPVPMVHDYLKENLHFQLGDAQRRGLQEFFRRAERLDLIELPHEMIFDDCPTL